MPDLKKNETSAPAIIESTWDQKRNLFFTHISGRISFNDVKNWEEGMYQESSKIPPNTEFTFLVDERQYEFENMDVHKCKRDVIPIFLARYGLILSALPEDDKKDLEKNTVLDRRNIRCIAMAMVHHDVDKMRELNKDFGNDQQKYLSDINTANQFLDKFKSS